MSNARSLEYAQKIGEFLKGDFYHNLIGKQVQNNKTINHVYLRTILCLIIYSYLRKTNHEIIKNESLTKILVSSLFIDIIPEEENFSNSLKEMGFSDSEIKSFSSFCNADVNEVAGQILTSSDRLAMLQFSIYMKNIGNSYYEKEIENLVHEIKTLINKIKIKELQGLLVIVIKEMET